MLFIVFLVRIGIWLLLKLFPNASVVELEIVSVSILILVMVIFCASVEGK